MNVRPSDDADLLYGAPAIAEFMNVRPRQVHSMIDNSDLPIFRIAGKLCARRSAIKAWLAEREAATAGQKRKYTKREDAP